VLLTDGTELRFKYNILPLWRSSERHCSLTIRDEIARLRSGSSAVMLQHAANSFDGFDLSSHVRRLLKSNDQFVFQPLVVSFLMIVDQVLLYGVSQGALAKKRSSCLSIRA
jgi:hypothetical protein